jgi:hypothetical protein
MAKVWIALPLGKTYRQDAALRWGLLSRVESSGHERRRPQRRTREHRRHGEDGPVSEGP